MSIRKQYMKLKENYIDTGLFDQNDVKEMSFEQFERIFEGKIQLSVLLRMYYVLLIEPLVRDKKTTGFDPNGKFFKEMVASSIEDEHKKRNKTLVSFVVEELKPMSSIYRKK